MYQLHKIQASFRVSKSDLSNANIRCQVQVFLGLTVEELVK